MTDSRNQILDRIRKGRGRKGPVEGDAALPLHDRLKNAAANLVPARSRIDRFDRIDLFVSMAEEAAATVDRVSSSGDVPKAVSSYLASQNLPSKIVMAPDESLDDVPWPQNGMLDIRRGMPEPDDDVGLSGAYAAIAETGTLMVTSGSHHPSRLNLLPDTHVVVLTEDQILGAQEDGWAKLRADTAASGGKLPRTVIFITGPSRSADIEQTLQLGAHGPRRLHIVLVETKDGDGGSD